MTKRKEKVEGLGYFFAGVLAGVLATCGTAALGLLALSEPLI